MEAKTTQPGQKPPPTPERVEGLPEGAGLPQGRSAAEEGPEREGDALMAAAAAGAGLRDSETDALTAYYMGNEPKPGTRAGDLADVEVDIGRNRAKWKCKVRPIGWAEWRTAQREGEKAGADSSAGIDTLVIASWVVAQGLVKPALGPVVQRLQTEARENNGKIVDHETKREKDPPAHAPALLLDFFEKQPGSLLELNQKILELSKLQQFNDAVHEIEAGKT